MQEGTRKLSGPVRGYTVAALGGKCLSPKPRPYGPGLSWVLEPEREHQEVVHVVPLRAVRLAVVPVQHPEPQIDVVLRVEQHVERDPAAEPVVRPLLQVRV